MCVSQPVSQPAHPRFTGVLAFKCVVGGESYTVLTQTSMYIHAYNHFPYVAILSFRRVSCLCHLLSSSFFSLLNLNENRECLSQSGSQPAHQVLILRPTITHMCSGGESTLWLTYEWLCDKVEGKVFHICPTHSNIRSVSCILPCQKERIKDRIIFFLLSSHPYLLSVAVDWNIQIIRERERDINTIYSYKYWETPVSGLSFKDMQEGSSKDIDSSSDVLPLLGIGER